MSVVNPCTGREIGKDSCRFQDIVKTGAFDLSKELPEEKVKPEGINNLKGNGRLIEYIRQGKYGKAFDYMFKTEESIPANIVGRVLNKLIGQRITFYCLEDRKFTTYVVSKYTKNKIIEKMIVPKTECLIILGGFYKDDVRKRFYSTIADPDRARSYIYIYLDLK